MFSLQIVQNIPSLSRFNSFERKNTNFWFCLHRFKLAINAAWCCSKIYENWMLVMFMMNEALAHIHSEFLTRNLVNLFKVIFWAIFCPFSTNMGAQLQRKSTSGYPGCTQRLNSPPLQCWLCRLCKLIVFFKSLFQLSATSKVLKKQRCYEDESLT